MLKFYLKALADLPEEPEGLPRREAFRNVSGPGRREGEAAFADSMLTAELHSLKGCSSLRDGPTESPGNRIAFWHLPKAVAEETKCIRGTFGVHSPQTLTACGCLYAGHVRNEGHHAVP